MEIALYAHACTNVHVECVLMCVCMYVYMNLVQWRAMAVFDLYGLLTHVLGLPTLLAGRRHFQIWCRPLKDGSHLRLPLFPFNVTSILSLVV